MAKKLGPEELRRITDSHLLGRFMTDIARECGRSVKAVAHIIESKIGLDYTEDGDRKSLIDKIATVGSVLDPKREPTTRDLRYIAYLCLKKLPDERISIVVNLPIEVLKTINTNRHAPR